jgi:hypothetical protein
MMLCMRVLRITGGETWCTRWWAASAAAVYSLPPRFMPVVSRVNRRDPMSAKWVVVLLGLSLLCACASVPTGPRVLALPAVGKPMDVFQAEEEGCRAYAQQRTAAASPSRQTQYDIAYVQCMYSKGNVIPDIGAPEPRGSLPPPGAPPPPATVPR